MKNIPMFTTEYGVANLFLKNVPYSGAAFVQIILFVQQIINEILLRAGCYIDKHREYSYLKGSLGACLRQFYYNLQQKKTTFTSFICFTFKTNLPMLQYFKLEGFFIIHIHTQ